MYTSDSTLYILCIVHSTLYSVQCTVCIVNTYITQYILYTNTFLYYYIYRTISCPFNPAPANRSREPPTKSEEWSLPTAERIPSTTTGCWCTGQSSPRSPRASRTPEPWGRRWRWRVWWGWWCGKASCVAWWYWRWYPDRVPRNKCT